MHTFRATDFTTWWDNKISPPYEYMYHVLIKNVLKAHSSLSGNFVKIGQQYLSYNST